MTEDETQRIYLALLDHANSIDEHVTPDDVVAGLQDLIREIYHGVYSDAVVRERPDDYDRFGGDDYYTGPTFLEFDD